MNPDIAKRYYMQYAHVAKTDPTTYENIVMVAIALLARNIGPSAAGEVVLKALSTDMSHVFEDFEGGIK